MGPLTLLVQWQPRLLLPKGKQILPGIQMRIFLTRRQQLSCVNVTLVKMVKVQTAQFFLSKLQERFVWSKSPKLNYVQGQSGKGEPCKYPPVCFDCLTCLEPFDPWRRWNGSFWSCRRSRRFNEWTSCKHQELHWKTSSVDVTTKYRSGLRRNAPALETDVCVMEGVEGHL